MRGSATVLAPVTLNLPISGLVGHESAVRCQETLITMPWEAGARSLVMQFETG